MMAALSNATVTLSQIAELAGYRPSAVSNWRKRFGDFPQPVETGPGGRDLFALDQVEEWLRAHGRFDPDRTSERLLFEAMTLARGSILADEGIEALATAIALAEAADRLDDAIVADAAERIWLVELGQPHLKDVFEPLQRLDSPVANQMIALADSVESSRRSDVFEWVLGRRSRFVETRTSDELTALLVLLLGSAQSVLDPAAGEGGVLAAAAERRGPKTALYGQEINRTAYRTAVQRFLLRRLDIDMRCGDSLLEDQFLNLKVDAVICDPPYRMDNPLIRHGMSPAHWVSFAASRAKTADFLWLDQAIEHLTDDGHAYVLLPMGTLSRRAREREMRIELIRRGAVEAVIALPPGSAQHTNIPLALWIVQRGASADRPVLLVDAAGSEAESKRRLDRMLIERIGDTVSRWRERGAVDPADNDIAAAVPTVELLAADAELVPARWINATSTVTEEDRAREADDAMTEFVAARNRLVHAAAEVPTLEGSVPAQWVTVRDLAVGDVADVVRGVRIRPEDCLAEGVRVLRTRDIRDTIAEEEPCYVVPDEMKPQPALTQPGDIIVSPASGRLRAIVDEQGGHVLASPLQALRFRTDWLDTYVAAAFLESPRNRRFAKGVNSGYARVDLRDLELPLLPLQDARRLREALDQLNSTERNARELAARAEDVRQSILNSVGHAGDDAWK
jgi:type I restriction-modification system DNA methylase subunit